jgi:predicted peptidase
MKEKLLSGILCIILICTALPGGAVTAYASETDGNYSINPETRYLVLEDNIVEERISFLDVDSLEATVITRVLPSGESTISIVKEDTVIFSQKRESDYDAYYQLATRTTSNVKRSKGKASATVNKDITGSQYKHRRLGSNSYMIEKDEMDSVIKGSIVSLSVLILEKLAINASGAVFLATTLYGLSSALTPYDKIKISCTSYEVLFTYDDGYYTHCYHSAYTTYDSGGHALDSGVFYEQVIGG